MDQPSASPDLAYPLAPTGVLFEQVYDQLRRAAQEKMRNKRTGHTLSATALGVSHRTVKRDWTFARGWLRQDLERRDEA